ncbi:M23 family metallopeptidase [Aeromicrobium chenweiae]|nr:M23 family metallopeptidase [Aeromicrobium chenweiae]
MTRPLAALPIVLLLLPVAADPGTPETWSWPLDDHAVGERFDPPADEYGAGHRGIDLDGAVGDRVRAVAPGRVAFVGEVGGVPVISIDHGTERSTYQPVRARVRNGDAVRAGEVIGTLLGTHSHCAGPCLHLGRRVGHDYLDPLDLLGGARFRLISADGPPPSPPAGIGGDLQRPVGGPVTSPFGMRVHPLTGVRKLHDGTDFGVPCGTPVHAAAAGTVVDRGYAGAYGQRVVVRHSPGVETSYNHLSGISVAAGERVRPGQVIGRSGTTGLSTGCHLHLMLVKDGTPVDPMPHL